MCYKDDGTPVHFNHVLGQPVLVQNNIKKLSPSKYSHYSNKNNLFLSLQDISDISNNLKLKIKRLYLILAHHKRLSFLLQRSKLFSHHE